MEEKLIGKYLQEVDSTQATLKDNTNIEVHEAQLNWDNRTPVVLEDKTTQYKINGVTINVWEVTTRTVGLEEGTVEIVDGVKLEVIGTDNFKYWVDCYYTGDEESDSYVVRVYDHEKALGNSLLYGQHEIAVSDVDSNGDMYDNGLQLKDETVEEAIWEVLFGTTDKAGIIIPF